MKKVSALIMAALFVAIIVNQGIAKGPQKSLFADEYLEDILCEGISYYDTNDSKPAKKDASRDYAQEMEDTFFTEGIPYAEEKKPAQRLAKQATKEEEGMWYTKILPRKKETEPKKVASALVSSFKKSSWYDDDDMYL